MILTILLLAMFINVNAQTTVQEINSRYYLNGNSSITLTQNEIKISENGIEKFNSQISGYKSYLTSPGGEYFLISNYAYNETQPQFEISLLLFNGNSDLVNELKLNAASDLPHPLFKINDEGKIFAFDPLAFRLTIYSDNEQKEIQLEKDITFEMERSAFIEAAGDEVYVLTSIRPLMLEEADANANLYKINLSNNLVDKTLIDLSIPNLLYVKDDDIIISGVKFNNTRVEGKTFKLNQQLQVLNSNNRSFKKMNISGDDLIGLSDNSVLKLNEDLTAETEYKFNNSRLITFAVNEKLIKVLVKEADSDYIVTLNDELQLVKKQPIHINDITDYASILFSGDRMMIHTKDKTYLAE